MSQVDYSIPPMVKKSVSKSPSNDEGIVSETSKEKIPPVVSVNSTKIVQHEKKIPEAPKPRQLSTSRVVRPAPASVKQLCSRWEVN